VELLILLGTGDKFENSLKVLASNLTLTTRLIGYGKIAGEYLRFLMKKQAVVLGTKMMRV
jgi:hypothetical protein